ncbi:M20 peptidase aminoacylase family protein [Paenibacillus sp. WLX2291]|uniref:M20 peptidase aminoacylase family protein n=1 Tax=Paenibacillus sp. WLX2291 TaxID=3296934 RepID=UPI0039844FEE
MTVATDTQLRATLTEVFEHLHAHPELSMKEWETTAYIKQWLEKLGCRVTTFDDCPGVIGELGSGQPVIGLRADMDALWQEVDGEYCGNHSCGHDAHMTMVLGTVMALKETGKLPQGTIRFVFQPAEEIGAGAIALVEKGVFDDMDFYFGVHLRPIQELPDGKAAPAIVHGASRGVKGVIRGDDAHGARPHLGTNAIEVAASIVNELGHIHMDPRIPHSVKMTSLHAGEMRNIIPGNAQFSLDTRAQTNEVMEELTENVQRVVDSVAMRYGADVELEIAHGLAAAKVDEQAQQYMAEAITAILGVDNTSPALLTTGGDDFHQVAIRKPHVKGTMLGLGCDLSPGLHHPKMSFNRDAMFTGVDILTQALLITLEREAK